MTEDIHLEQRSPNKLRAADVWLLIGALAAVIALGLILALARGGQVAALGILWGWVVNLAIWIYLIVAAI